MKFKGTASLVVVFLILGVYYFFVDLPGEKKKLQHQVLDLEMTLLKIKEVIREHEKSNDNK